MNASLDRNIKVWVTFDVGLMSIMHQSRHVCTRHVKWNESCRIRMRLLHMFASLDLNIQVWVVLDA